jgi:hypothetical protein
MLGPVGPVSKKGSTGVSRGRCSTGSAGRAAPGAKLQPSSPRSEPEARSAESGTAPWRWRMYSILYIIGAIVVIIVVLKVLGLY